VLGACGGHAGSGSLDGGVDGAAARKGNPDDDNDQDHYTPNQGDCDDFNAAAAMWQVTRERFPTETEAWIGETNALAEAGRHAEAATCIDAAQSRFPANFDVRVATASLATSMHLLDKALADWLRLKDDFPNHPIAYVRAANALQDAGRGDEADALLNEALRRFPNDSEVNRAYASIAVRRNDLAGAARRLQDAAARNPTDLALAWQWVEAVRQLHRLAEARDAIRTVMERFPTDPKVTQQSVRVLWQAGERDEAIAIWTSAIGNPAFPQALTFELASALLSDTPSQEHARTLLRHSITEPDTGERYWRPSLAAVFRLHRVPHELASIANEFLQTLAPAAFTPAVRDVLRAILERDLPDEEFLHFFQTYLSQDRLGIVGCIFTNLDTPGETGARICALFEAYIVERMRTPEWIRQNSAAGLVASLQFAACASHEAYRQIVAAGRTHFNAAELAARNELQTSDGILGSILASAGTSPIPAPSVAKLPAKLRVALCISGQLRGYQQTFKSWKGLQLRDHDTTIFVDSWFSVGFNWERIWAFLRGRPSLHHAIHTGDIAFVKARYPRLAQALEQTMVASGSVTVAQLQDFYGTPHVRLEDDTSVAFARRGNQWKMYHKMAASARAANESGRTFDLMIRARPDREIVGVSDFDLHRIQAESAADRALFMLDHPNVIRDGYFWLGDQFAFGTPEIVSAYCNTLNTIETMAAAGQMPRDVDLRLPMHVTPFLMTFYRGILVRPIPGVEFGGFVNPPLLTVGEIHKLILQDLQAREADDFDLQLVDACEQALK
jgi:tetratricopeptide (TPR) repeat protein